MHNTYFDTLQTVGNDIETFEIFAALARNAKDLYVINLVGSRGREFPFCEGGDESYPLQLSDTPKHLYGCSDI